MDPVKGFAIEVNENIARLQQDSSIRDLSFDWIAKTAPHKYSYNFNWLGRPIIQFPQDILAIQELIWSIKPDLVIETGIAHGGSLVLSASILAMLDYADAASQGLPLYPTKPKRKVLGIDIDIRPHNREALARHPMSSRIELIGGSSIAADVITKVRQRAESAERIMVFLDSNHTHDHVLAELKAYAPLVSPGSYCVVFDTVIEDMPPGMFADRPWDRGNNPKTAVREFLQSHSEFEIDKSIQSKLLITVAPDGYLQRTIRCAGASAAGSTST
jgi:cephalosporin hydroxylase